MSKAPKNIEKILLGVAVAAAAGLGALGVMKAGSVEEDFSAGELGERRNETAVAGAEKVPETVNSLQLDRTLEAARVPAEVTETGDRPVDLFVGVPLFANRDNPNQPFDPVGTPEPMHPPIPNLWWIEHNVPFIYADSPQRDPDEDGFTNLEEFEAGTDPGDSASHPDLIAKLNYIRDESYEWLLEYGGELNENWTPRIKDGEGKSIRTSFTNPVEPGGLFFREEPFLNRFKFIQFEDRQVQNERLNIPQDTKFAIYEDQKPNKMGMRYEVPQRVPKAELPQYVQFDRTAVLELEALGQEGREFKVEEFTRFSLPPGGENEKYFMKEVTPEKIVVEWEDEGETRSVEIPKGE